MDYIGIVWLIPLIMGLAAAINGIGCKKLGKLAGYITCAAMIVTFVLSTLIFLEVKHLAHDNAGHGSDHASGEVHAASGEEHASGDHSSHDHDEHLAHDDVAHENWALMNEQQRKDLKNAYMFVKAEDPENLKPWESGIRGGLGGYVSLWRWIDIPNALPGGKSLTIDFAFQVDQLTALFLMFVSFVGSLVFIYATGYMKEEHHGKVELDPGYARFFSYLALFAMSMYILVLGSNMVMMFIGWEGVGLCSYLLIGYYFDRQFSEKLSCSDAGKKAFVVNRIGDFGIILGMGLLFWGFGTLDFQELIHGLTMGTVPDGFGYSGTIITAATLLLFLGATGKSAQIPLFVWLPDAMAGPTPVSALIHAATMVTAGVYMLARLNPFFMMSPTTLVVIATAGALTAFVAATIALTQRGIKKILAYSTVSQLGYMFVAIGIGSFAAGLFHVFTHAFFKACLFLCAGSVIHALHHQEDVFKMGGLLKKMPLTGWTYLIATLAIAGVIPFAGFFSKDEILFLAHTSAAGGSQFHMMIWIIGVITAALTAFYMARSFFLAFTGKTRMSEEKYSHVHESPINMTSVLCVLAVCSIVVGFLNVPKDLKPIPGIGGSESFHHFLAPITDRGAIHVANTYFGGYEGEYAPAKLGALIVGEVTEGEAGMLDSKYHGPAWPLAGMSILIALGGIGFAWFLYGSGRLDKAEKFAKPVKPLWNISWYGWKWDDLYDFAFVKGAMRFYEGVLWCDKKLVDGVVNGLGKLSNYIGNEFRRLQNGQVQVYGLVMFIGVCLFLLWFTLGLATFLGEYKPAKESARSNKQSTAAVTVPVMNEQIAVLEIEDSTPVVAQADQANTKE